MTFSDTLFSLLHKGGPTVDANIWRPMAILIFAHETLAHRITCVRQSIPPRTTPELCAPACARALLAHEPCTLRLHEAFDFPGVCSS